MAISASFGVLSKSHHLLVVNAPYLAQSLTRRLTPTQNLEMIHVGRYIRDTFFA